MRPRPRPTRTRFHLTRLLRALGLIRHLRLLVMQVQVVPCLDFRARTTLSPRPRTRATLRPPHLTIRLRGIQHRL